MKNFSRIKQNYKTWLQLSPFLLLYIVISLSFSSEEFQWDESRYVQFAKNISNGFYSPPSPNIDLWNGPGYPIFISFLLLLNFSFHAIKITNAFLLYLSLILNYNTFTLYVTRKKALFASVLLGLYYPIYEMLPYLLTETLSWFLISMICYVFCSFFRRARSNNFFVFAGFLLSYLVMTKVAFGNVVFCMAIVSLIYWIFYKKRNVIKKSLIIFGCALIFCLPWLIHNYFLTGRFLYWANSGNMSLYTMSSIGENELGDWSNEHELSLKENHQDFIDSIQTLKPLQKDDAYLHAAINNIKSHPQKFLRNIAANIGRLLFSYPYTNTPQNLKTFYTLIPNMFLFVFICICLLTYLKFYKNYPPEISLLLIFFLLYLAESSLVSAYRRMFYITVPFWFLFILFTFQNMLEIKVNKEVFWHRKT